MSSVRWFQAITRLAALTAALLIGADDAEVQLVDGTSYGAGGSSAFTSLVSAAAAEPVMVRQAPLMAQAAPQAYPGGSLSGLFKGGGILGGFAAGFLGSGVLGLLFGRGLFGELGGVASYVGLFCQFALLVTLCWLIWTRWRSGAAADAAARSPRQLADAYLRSRDNLHSGAGAPVGVDVAVETKTKPGSRRPVGTDTGGAHE